MRPQALVLLAGLCATTLVAGPAADLPGDATANAADPADGAGSGAAEPAAGTASRMAAPPAGTASGTAEPAAGTASRMAAPPAAAPTICLQPLGRYERRLLDHAERGVAFLYGFPVRRLAPMRLPKSAYHAPRGRYRAEKLLAHLDGLVASTGCSIVVGFTAVDISTTKGAAPDWGVLGLATIGGTSAVVSTYRCHRSARNTVQVAKRTVNVVNHELGHALGLEHEPTSGCIMNDARGSVHTVDGESGLFCDACRARVQQGHGVRLPAPATFDWKQVLAR